MRVLAFSDLHHSARAARTIVAASRSADLVIGAGDFCNRRQALTGALELLRGALSFSECFAGAVRFRAVPIRRNR